MTDFFLLSITVLFSSFNNDSCSTKYSPSNLHAYVSINICILLRNIAQIWTHLSFICIENYRIEKVNLEQFLACKLLDVWFEMTEIKVTFSDSVNEVKCEVKCERAIFTSLHTAF